MAVEIIPKPSEETPLWANILLIISIAILLAVALSHFVLNTYVKEAGQAIKELDLALVEEKTPQNLALQKEMLGYQKKIDDFSFLLDAHKASSNAFAYLEGISHPRVRFSNFSLSSQAEGAVISVSGRTDSFQSLGQQLIIFKEEQLIKDVILSGVSFAEEKRLPDQKVPISFSFTLSLSSEIFIPQL